MIISDLHLLRPWWLLAIIPTAVLWWMLLKTNKHNQLWKRFIDAHLLPYLLITDDSRSKKYEYYILAIAWIITILILSGPSISGVEQTVYQPKFSRVLLVDLSTHTLSEDLKPSRLEITKHKLHTILKNSSGMQTALIVFAKSAYQIVPLTDDIENIANQVYALHPIIMPIDGHNLSNALNKALQLLKQGNATIGEVVLLTAYADNNSSAITAAKAISTAGFKLKILGIATANGAPLKNIQGNYKYDVNNKLLFSKLAVNHLLNLAKYGNGLYRTVTKDSSDLNQLLQKSITSQDINKSTTKISSWQDIGTFMLLLILPIASLGFRRGWLLTTNLLIGLIFITPQASYASLTDFFYTNNQLGRYWYEQQEFSKSADYFDDKIWKATALYKDKKYSRAAEQFAKAAKDDVENIYNKGLALAKDKQLPDALQAFKEVLKIEPDHSDAKFNHDLIAKWLKDNPLPKNKNNKDCGCDNKENNDSKNTDKNNKDNKNNSDNQKNNDASTNSKDDMQMPSQKQQQTKYADNKKQSENWLKKIPDNPSGLLKAKIYNQYLREQQE